MWGGMKKPPHGTSIGVEVKVGSPRKKKGERKANQFTFIGTQKKKCQNLFLRREGA